MIAIKNPKELEEKMDREVTTAPQEEWETQTLKELEDKLGCCGGDFCDFPSRSHDRVLLDYIKRQRLSARTEVLKSLLEKIEAIETTLAVSHSDSYQIGQNHGRQEMKRSVTDIIKGMMNEK